MPTCGPVSGPAKTSRVDARPLVLRRRTILGALAGFLALSLVLTPSVPIRAQTTTTGPSGLPLPRFVSLKSDRINVRRGPGRDHEVMWVFVRAGLPVEVVQEFDNWRRIRDSEGAEGWVFHSLLSGRRTALIEPWQDDSDPVPVTRYKSADSKVAAFLEPGVLADVHECDGTRCRISGEGWEGWIEQNRLWGVYPSEIID